MKIMKRNKTPAPIHIISGDHILVTLRDDVNRCHYNYWHKLSPQILDTLIIAQLSKQELKELNLKIAETIILGESV